MELLHQSGTTAIQLYCFSIKLFISMRLAVNIQGAKKMPFKPIFEFQTLGGVFLGVKNVSKNFGNQKNNSLN